MFFTEFKVPAGNPQLLLSHTNQIKQNNNEISARHSLQLNADHIV
jgi:hypothetical protein